MAGDVQGGYESTLCWECKNTDRFKCPWFNPADPQPVPGWVAERRVRPLLGETYTVKECPNFEPEPPREVQHTFVPTSGVRGVTWDVATSRWEVRIQGHGKKYYLGRYVSLAKAIAVRRDAERAIARGDDPRHVTVVRTMGYPGVYRGKRTWTARITYKGVNYYLGHFKTEARAIEARKAAEEAIARGEVPKRAT